LYCPAQGGAEFARANVRRGSQPVFYCVFILICGLFRFYAGSNIVQPGLLCGGPRRTNPRFCEYVKEEKTHMNAKKLLAVLLTVAMVFAVAAALRRPMRPLRLLLRLMPLRRPPLRNPRLNRLRSLKNPLKTRSSMVPLPKFPVTGAARCGPTTPPTR
jgi:hypothetical protein